MRGNQAQWIHSLIRTLEQYYRMGRKKNISADKDKTTKGKDQLNRSSTKNVNEFLHFVSNPALNEKDLEWALNLRKADPKIRLDTIPNVPFSVYNKTITCFETKHTNSDLLPGINMSKYSHTISKLKPSHTLINFQENLRQTIGDPRQKQWWSFPKVQHKQHPKMLAKNSITKTKNPELCSALDSQSNYPPYTQKILNTRNFNQVKHMVTRDYNVGNIAWQTSLRS